MLQQPIFVDYTNGSPEFKKHQWMCPQNGTSGER